MDEKHLAIAAIRKKLVGKKLNYKEIYAIMDQISEKKLGDVLTTYFAASGFSKGFSDEELYYLTKAMVETGDKLKFSGIVADKHSIGGIPGTRTTLIIVPIIAAAGFKIPKSSSRAITTPGGTADDMEVLAQVEFTKEEIDKILVSIMAKKIAFGSNHVVIDLPYGAMVKVHTIKDAQILKGKFEYLAKRFQVKIKVLIHKTDEPAA